MTNGKSLRLLAVLLCLIPAALLVCGLVLPPQYNETYLGEMTDKQRLLHETPGPRIVVVGGSGVPFALNTPVMNEALPEYSTVDFGLYADLGMQTMLDWVTPEIRQGDLIILMPEQNEQMLSAYVGGESIWQACDGSLLPVTRLSVSSWGRMAAAYPVFAGKKLRYAVTGAPKASGIYARSSFNEYGDIAAPGRECNIMPQGWQATQPIRFEPGMAEDALIASMNRLAEAAAAKGAQAVYHFPPMNEAAVTSSTEEIDRYYDWLSEQLKLPILGDPHHCVMDRGWFYDSNFHLNSSGSMVFTDLLIRDIKVFLRDTSAARLTLPSMPPMAVMEDEGDNSDEQAFEYTPDGSGWCITGLTERGMHAEQLILPAAHDGQPVTGIDSGVFRNNTVIRQITIGPNMAALPDGMFNGCIRLEQVVLTGNPSAYAVGDNWRQGASFMIAVPEEQLDAYLRSYFWQRYEPWIRAVEEGRP